MNEELLRMNFGIKYCVFDFEAEDLNLASSKPYQFASILATSKNIIEETEIMIGWNDLNMSKEAAAISHFDYNIWSSNSVEPKEAFLKINDNFARADVVAGHNILGYDIHLYKNACKKLGIKAVNIEDKIFDTLACGKGIKLDCKFSGSDFFFYQLRMLNTVSTATKKRGFATLNALADYYGIQVEKDRLHNAKYDVYLNYQVLMKMIWDVEVSVSSFLLT